QVNRGRGRTSVPPAAASSLVRTKGHGRAAQPDIVGGRQPPAWPHGQRNARLPPGTALTPRRDGTPATHAGRPDPGRRLRAEVADHDPQLARQMSGALNAGHLHTERTPIVSGVLHARSPGGCYRLDAPGRVSPAM